MLFHEMYPKEHLAAGDLNGQDVVVTINRIEMIEVGAEKKRRPLVHFAEMAKGMIFNVTNGLTVLGLYGEDSANWIGKKITLYPTHTVMSAKRVPCLRIRDSVPVAAQPTPPTDPLAALASLSKEQIAAILAAKS